MKSTLEGVLLSFVLYGRVDGLSAFFAGKDNRDEITRGARPTPLPAMELYMRDCVMENVAHV